MFQALFWEVSMHLYTPTNPWDICKVGMIAVTVIPTPRWGSQGQGSKVNSEPGHQHSPTSESVLLTYALLLLWDRGSTNRNMQPTQNNQRKGKGKAVTQVLTRHSIIIIWTFHNDLESHPNPTEPTFPFHSTSKLQMALSSIPWINFTEPGRILLIAFNHFRMHSI